MTDETQLTFEDTIGKEITGLVPAVYRAVGAFRLGTHEPLVAITFVPPENHADFKEPVVIMLPVTEIEAFIRLIRISQGAISTDAHKSGTA